VSVGGGIIDGDSRVHAAPATACRARRLEHPLPRTTLERLLRIARLDLGAIGDVQRDRGATAAGVLVAVASLAAFALGGWLWWLVSDFAAARETFVKSVLFGTLAAFALWLGWLLVVYLLVQRAMRVAMRVDELLRAGGFATFPLVLGLLMVVPRLAFGVGLLALALWFVAMQAAIERVSGIRGGAALQANAAGFALWAGVLALLASADDPLAPGVFLAVHLWNAAAEHGLSPLG